MSESLREEIETMFSELSGVWTEKPTEARAVGMHMVDARHAPVNGKPTRGGARLHPPHPRREEAMMMLAEGVPLKKIARMLPVSRASLHRWRKENG